MYIVGSKDMFVQRKSHSRQQIHLAYPHQEYEQRLLQWLSSSSKPERVRLDFKLNGAHLCHSQSLFY